MCPAPRTEAKVRPWCSTVHPPTCTKQTDGRAGMTICRRPDEDDQQCTGHWLASRCCQPPASAHLASGGGPWPPRLKQQEKDSTADQLFTSGLKKVHCLRRSWPAHTPSCPASQLHQRESKQRAACRTNCTPPIIVQLTCLGDGQIQLPDPVARANHCTAGTRRVPRLSGSSVAAVNFNHTFPYATATPLSQQ